MRPSGASRVRKAKTTSVLLQGRIAPFFSSAAAVWLGGSSRGEVALIRAADALTLSGLGPALITPLSKNRSVIWNGHGSLFGVNISTLQTHPRSGQENVSRTRMKLDLRCSRVLKHESQGGFSVQSCCFQQQKDCVVRRAGGKQM